MSDALPNNPSPEEADTEQQQEQAAPKLSLEDQLDALLLNIDKVEPGMLQAAGVEVPDAPEEEPEAATEPETQEAAAEESTEQSDLAATAEEAGETEPVVEEAAVVETAEPVAASDDQQSIDEQLKAMLTTPAEFDPPEEIPTDPAAPAAEADTSAIEQVDEQLATEAAAATETPAETDDEFSNDSLESALDQMIEQATNVESQETEAQPEPAASEAPPKDNTVVEAVTEPVEVEPVEQPAGPSPVEAILDQVDEQVDDAVEAKPDPLAALAEIAGDEEDDELVAQLDELLSETVAAAETDQPTAVETPPPAPEPELAQTIVEQEEAETAIETPVVSETVESDSADDEIAGDMLSPEQLVVDQQDPEQPATVEDDQPQPSAEQPAATQAPAASNEPADDDEIAGDMLTPEQLVAQQQQAELPAEPQPADVNAAETPADNTVEEQSVSDIDAQLAMEADDAIAGEFETPEQVAAAEMTEQQAFSDDSAVPPAPAAKPPLVAPAEPVDDNSTVKSPVEKPAGFVADSKDVARELDEQPELVAGVKTQKVDQSVAKAPSVTGKAVPSIFNKSPLLQKAFAFSSIFAAVLQRICALFDRFTLAKLPAVVRDVVGYFALVTIFNAVLLFLYIIFIKD